MQKGDRFDVRQDITVQIGTGRAVSVWAPSHTVAMQVAGKSMSRGTVLVYTGDLAGAPPGEGLAFFLRLEAGGPGYAFTQRELREYLRPLGSTVLQMGDRFQVREPVCWNPAREDHWGPARRNEDTKLASYLTAGMVLTVVGIDLGTPYYVLQHSNQRSWHMSPLDVARYLQRLDPAVTELPECVLLAAS